MKKLVVLGMGVCLVLAFASCKSSESAYKKAYEKAKQQELAEPQVEAPVEVTPVVAAPVTTPKVADTSGVRQEKVTVVSGNEGLKDYSVVAGSFGVKANAEGLKDWLDAQGYQSTIAFNADKAMYRVIVNSFADKAAAAEARDAFKAKYPNRRISREPGCCIVFIDFFLVIYTWKEQMLFPNKKAVTGKLLLFY